MSQPGLFIGRQLALLTRRGGLIVSLSVLAGA
jgi:hypothetical protein